MSMQGSKHRSPLRGRRLSEDNPLGDLPVGGVPGPYTEGFLTYSRGA